MADFRLCTAEDAGLISRIHASSWRGSYAGLIPQHYLDRLPDGYWTPSVRSWLSDGRFEGKLVIADGVPAGCCIYGRGRDESHGDWGEIVSLYMLPDFARQGLGGALLESCLADLRREGYTRFYLWCIDGNAAADRFYAAHGFRVTDEHVDYAIGGAPVRDIRYVRVEEGSST